jgi:hypothetical protein
MDKHELEQLGTNNAKLVIANTVPINPKVVELIEDRALRLSEELHTMTINLLERMARVRSFS